jgi:hypothetical protein
LTWILPLWMKPSFLNLLMKKLTRDRVVPTISASISSDASGSILPSMKQQGSKPQAEEDSAFLTLLYGSLQLSRTISSFVTSK